MLSIYGIVPLRYKYIYMDAFNGYIKLKLIYERLQFEGEMLIIQIAIDIPN